MHAVRLGLKLLANGIGFLLILPALCLHGVGTVLLGRDASFGGWSQALSLIPGGLGVYLRRAFYRVTLEACDTDTTVEFLTTFSRPGVRLGRGAWIGSHCTIGSVRIGDDVLIASHVSITSGRQQHRIDRLDVPIRFQNGRFEQISIGTDTWVGERAVVMADVGAHCVIGAGAVVTSPIPDYAVALGNPARVIRDRRDTAKNESTPYPELSPPLGETNALNDVASRPPGTEISEASNPVCP